MEKRKRRILEKLKLTEISGVDRPCQEGATVAIMKRKEPNMAETENIEAEELEGALLDLEAQVAHLNKQLKEAVRSDPQRPIVVNVEDFDKTVTEIRKRDNCSRTDALAKARKVNPVGYATFNADYAPKDFAALVEAEIAKGCPESVAAQRVGLKHPDLVACVLEKAKHPFLTAVDAIQSQDGCSRAEAMSRARKKEPVKFAAYQGL